MIVLCRELDRVDEERHLETAGQHSTDQLKSGIDRIAGPHCQFKYP